MITTDLVAIRATDSPGLVLNIVTRETGEKWVPGGRDGKYYLTPAPTCPCCGEPRTRRGRCEKHQDRNPCAIEGCRRTAKAEGRDLGNDQVVCSTHWRRYVPAGSRARLAYNAHFRRARKLGWDQPRIDAFHRFWDVLIVRIRRLSTEGRIDPAAIDALFGWD